MGRTFRRKIYRQNRRLFDMKKGNPYGTHRVISPKGVLPQPADVIDNNMDIFDNEVLIDVKTLNIDSASFTEISKRCDGNIEKIKKTNAPIVVGLDPMLSYVPEFLVKEAIKKKGYSPPPLRAVLSAGSIRRLLYPLSEK